jgi:4-amino-4-deoxy-L-arabinose transferase-like glycosyltransferase
LTYQLTAAAVGTTAILMVGVAGRQIAGKRVGLIAASLAALYPGFWQYERELLSEVVLLPLVALVLWLAYRYRDKPSLLTLLVLSGTCAILALGRAEQIALFVLLVVPLVIASSSVSWPRRLAWLGMSAITAIALIAPWALWNTARFREPVILSTGLGTTMVAGACDTTFSGDKLGHFDTPSCFYPHLKELEGKDRSEGDLRMRRVALDYSRDHATELPRVVAAREGRTFSLYRPFQEVRLASEWSGSPSWVGYVSTWMYWAMLPFAVAGVFLLRRQRIAVYPLLVEFVIVALVAAGTFGLIRYRAAIEVPFVILAAVALNRTWSYVHRRRSGVEVIDPPRPEPVNATQGASAGVAHARPPG